jgi:Arc/MetJ-type ribon-helix-helix transcriptional regulator
MKENKTSTISARISKEDKDKVRLHVKKGKFPSMSAFYRTAISRFLRELDAYEKKRLLEKKEILGKAREKEKREVERDMRELVRFIEDLY